jgi:hypothetical protein
LAAIFPDTCFIEFPKNIIEGQRPDDILGNIEYVTTGELINENKNKEPQTIVITVRFG